MINKAILLGNVGNDPEVKYASNGSAICSLSVATSETWKDKNSGENKTTTEWHKVSLFGKLAEVSGQYLKKGSKVYIEGKVQTRKWQDKTGQDRYTTEIVVSGFGGVLKMLDSKSESSGVAKVFTLFKDPANCKENPSFKYLSAVILEIEGRVLSPHSPVPI